ncbi:lipase/serine esteras-like protein [Bimuria novae-zelandiae CBS 107.79]|uniref:Lipase/serine esteras-like protein n=1 Tax=Bimuria novae-zelandiae CBS 107.79 TaxID=1447943 RepID=A0A6A5USE5_9PLEO|nr:lipase/serine esteras-like protein [Bimuria novae-zelandiae CBS 107.79]
MSRKVDHLVVLVHGLWGNPQHLDFLRKSLLEKYTEDKIHVLVTKRNAGSFTYDGIETGGERMAGEVEETLKELAQAGQDIKKISVIGYSLGGLIARYAIGLLYSKGLFEKITPVNFTTFATPHLGVRTPRRGYWSNAFNVLGARTLSTSGRQLFLIDHFRDTGRPLLSLLADADSIFIRALAQFKHRSLYANVINDKTVAFFTAGISQTDPFERLEEVKVNYLNGYEDVVVDARNSVSPKEPEVLPVSRQRLTIRTCAFFKKVPSIAFFLIFVPIGATLLLTTAAIQSVRSRQRIRLHEQGMAGLDVTGYRIPLIINSARQEMEDMYENINIQQGQDYLRAGEEELASPTQQRTFSFSQQQDLVGSDADSTMHEKSEDQLEFPTLALTEHQFKMIEHLDNVGFKKYPIHIKNVRYTHAAIIRRMDIPSFDEGRIVARHWLDHFEL